MSNSLARGSLPSEGLPLGWEALLGLYLLAELGPLGERLDGPPGPDAERLAERLGPLGMLRIRSLISWHNSAARSPVSS
jgi:hypothetical protein